MVKLAGSFIFKKHIQKKLDEFSPLPRSRCLPLNDQELVCPGSGWESVSPVLLDIVTNRGRFRDYCRSKGLLVPDYYRGTTLVELSEWAMRYKRFPLAIKSCANASGGTGIFRLEAFRELPRFFDRIQKSFPGAVLIEEWISAKAIIEISFIGGKHQLTTQIGLEKNLTGRTSWRLFPVPIPKSQRSATERILSVFGDFMDYKDLLLRFTVALTGKGPVLISISGGFNRLEYFPGWVDPVNIAPISVCPVSAKVENTGVFAFLKEFRRKIKQAPFPDEEALDPQTQNLAKYIAHGNRAAALFIGDNPATLQQNAKMLTSSLAEQVSDDNHQ